MLDVEWDACVLEPRHDRELEAYVRREVGAVPSAVPYFTASPWIVRSMASLSYFGAPLVYLDYELADLVGRPEQIVETVGVCALANELCRIGVVAQLE